MPAARNPPYRTINTSTAPNPRPSHGAPRPLLRYSKRVALHVEQLDDDEDEYAKTMRWFVASVITMFVAIVFAAVVLSGALEPSPPNPPSTMSQ